MKPNGRTFRIGFITLAFFVVIPFVFWTGKIMAHANFYNQAMHALWKGELFPSSVALAKWCDNEPGALKDPRYWLAMGSIDLRMGRVDRAQACFDEAMKLMGGEQ